MNVELWIALLAAIGVGGAIGWVIARRGAPKRSELDSLQQKLDAAYAETEEIRTGVGEHFEQSAVLFGRLAHDYRAFIEHFSESAQTLGISEMRARELLEQASQPLVTHEDPAPDPDAVGALAADGNTTLSGDAVPLQSVMTEETTNGRDGGDTEPVNAGARPAGAEETTPTQDPAAEDANDSTVAEVDFARGDVEDLEKQKAS